MDEPKISRSSTDSGSRRMRRKMVLVGTAVAVVTTIGLLALADWKSEAGARDVSSPLFQNFVRQQQSTGAVVTSAMVHQQEHGTTLQRERWATIEPGHETLTGICSVQDIRVVPKEQGVEAIQVECRRSGGTPSFIERLDLPGSAEPFAQHVHPGSALAYRGALTAIAASQTPGVHRDVFVQPDVLMACPPDLGCWSYRAPVGGRGRE